MIFRFKYVQYMTCSVLGKLNVFGRHSNNSELPIRPVDIVQKELTIFGTLINPFTFHEAVNLLLNMKDQ